MNSPFFSQEKTSNTLAFPKLVHLPKRQNSFPNEREGVQIEDNLV